MLKDLLLCWLAWHWTIWEIKHWGQYRNIYRYLHLYFCLDDRYIFGTFHRGFGSVLDFWSRREMVGLFTSTVCTLHQFCLSNLFRQFFYRCRPFFPSPPCLLGTLSHFSSGSCQFWRNYRRSFERCISSSEQTEWRNKHDCHYQNNHLILCLVSLFQYSPGRYAAYKNNLFY